MKVVIGTGRLTASALVGRVAVATGAGRGIGFEAARSLAWLGARVAIAEVDRGSGEKAAARHADGDAAGGGACRVPRARLCCAP